MRSEEQSLAEPEHDNGLEQTREQALRWLARREYARGELQRRLHAKGYSETDIATTLDALVENGLQSDRRFTEEYIRARGKRGYGPLRIGAELGERGISRELIDEMLDPDTEQWRERADLALRKRFPDPPSDLRERVRRERFLHYRGFASQQVKQAMRQYA